MLTMVIMRLRNSQICPSDPVWQHSTEPGVSQNYLCAPQKYDGFFFLHTFGCQCWNKLSEGTSLVGCLLWQQSC